MKRRFSYKNKQSFCSSLAKIDWNEIYSLMDAQLMFTRFHEIFLWLHNVNFPKRKIKLKYNNRKPYMSLKNGVPAYDGIESDTLKLSVQHICEHLAHVCNMSLMQGIFPQDLKLANVLPLYKSGDPQLLNNYRPVSLLSTLSEVLEKVMYTRLLSFLEINDILIGNQFGFRRSHSSYMALMVMIYEISQALDCGEHAVGIFLDFSKAFDTVNHSILLKKLYHYGISGNTLE